MVTLSMLMHRERRRLRADGHSVAAASAATAAATATVSAPAAAAATAAATFFPWPSFVDRQRAAVVLFQVQSFNGGCRFGIGRHLDEAEAFAATRVAVHDYLSALDAAKFRE
jgi:hypothetical protein